MLNTLIIQPVPILYCSKKIYSKICLVWPDKRSSSRMPTTKQPGKGEIWKVIVTMTSLRNTTYYFFKILGTKAVKKQFYGLILDITVPTQWDQVRLAKYLWEYLTQQVHIVRCHENWSTRSPNVPTHQNYNVSAIIRNNCSVVSKIIMNLVFPEN